MVKEPDNEKSPAQTITVDVDLVARMTALIESQQLELNYLRSRVKGLLLAAAIREHKSQAKKGGRPKKRNDDADLELLLAVEEERKDLGLRSRRAVLQHVLDGINQQNAYHGRPRRSAIKDAQHMKTLINRLSAAAKRLNRSKFPENSD